MYKELNSRILGSMFVSLLVVAALLPVSPGVATASEEGAAGIQKVQNPDEVFAPSNFINWPLLTGDWNGGRTCLRDKSGIRLISNFEINFAGNPIGGKVHAGTQAFNMFAGLNFDWGVWSKVLKGFEFQISMIWRFGSSLSLEDIGNKFAVQQVYGGHGVMLYDLWVRWTSKDKRYQVKFGRIAEGDDFMSDPIYWYYMNNAYDGNPVAIFYNSPMTAYPNSTWGVYGMVNPIDEWYLKLGVYGADTRIGQSMQYHGEMMGFDFNEGVYLIGQTGYRLNYGADDKGLKGDYNIGGYYNSGPYQGVSGKTNNIGGGYITFDQSLYYFGKDRNRFINLWGAFIVAPESSGLMPYFGSGGIVLKGISEKRPKDALALGVAGGKFSPALAFQQRKAGQSPQSYELQFEVAYWIQVTGFFFFSPDIQVIVNPGGTGTIPNALVLGFQTGMNL